MGAPRPPPAGGPGGGKKKRERVIKPKSPMSGHKFGHGAELRPSRVAARASEFEARQQAPAAAGKRHVTEDGSLHTDDEQMQQLYDLVKSGSLDARAAEASAALASGAMPAPPDDVDDLEDLEDIVSTAQYAKTLAIPPELAGKIQIVDDDQDFLNMTDHDQTEGANEMLDSDGAAKWAKRGGVAPRNDAQRAPGYELAAAARARKMAQILAGLKAKRGPKSLLEELQQQQPGSDSDSASFVQLAGGAARAC